MSDQFIRPIITFEPSGSLKKGKGAGEIVCSFKLNGDTDHLRTGIRINPSDWDRETNSIRPTSTENGIGNYQLAIIRRRFENLEAEALLHNKQLTRFDIRRFISENDPRKTVDFIHWCQVIINNSRRAASTARNFNALFGYLRKYKFDLKHSDINYIFITEFTRYLFSQGMQASNAKKLMIHFRICISESVRHHLIRPEDDPFINYVYPKVDKNDPVYLNEEELRNWIAYEPVNQIEEISCNLFLFACFTGLRISDIVSLNPAQLIREDGEWRIVLQMKKRKKTIRLNISRLFEGRPLAILAKYIDFRTLPSPSITPIFPKTEEQKVNRTLKVIAGKLKIPKSIHLHSGRHTFGYYIAKKTKDPMMVKALLGHEGIQTSMIYIHIASADVDNAIKNIDYNL